LQNAASAHIYGLDLDGAAQLGGGFRLRSGASFLHGEFAEFPNAAVNVPNPTCAVTAPCGDVTVSKNLSGYQLPKAPRFSGNLTLEYGHPLFNGKTTVGSTYYYDSGFPWESGGRVRQLAYGTLAAEIAWTPASERFRVMLWGKNLTNKNYLQSEFDTAGGDEVVYAAPRWFGVTGSVKF
jgi:iron complex outermembrane receptor protein